MHILTMLEKYMGKINNKKILFYILNTLCILLSIYSLIKNLYGLSLAPIILCLIINLCHKEKSTINIIVLTIACVIFGYNFYNKYTIVLPWVFSAQVYFNNKFGLVVLSGLSSLILFMIAYGFRSFITYFQKNFNKSDYKYKFKGRRLFICGINLIVAIAVGLLLLVVAYSLPTYWMNVHIKESAYLVSREGEYLNMLNWSASAIDNYTDSLMLLEAGFENKESALINALLVPNGQINDLTPGNILISHYLDDAGALEYTDIYNYPRYWHGYLIFLKPLLMVFNFRQIRQINLICQVLITLLIMFLMYKNNLKKYMMPYLLVYLMFNPLVISKSMQYCSCFYVMSIGIIAILLLGKTRNKKYDYLLFFNIGILTSYFDFLTYPYITFAIPMCFYMLLNNDCSLKERLISFIRLGFVWVCGYILMWGSKWILATLLTDTNVIKDAFETTLTRTSSVSNPLGEIEIYNYLSYVMQPSTILCLIYIGYCLIRYIKNKKEIRWDNMFMYSLIFIIPILWYALAQNHSFVHYWFTFRGCSASLAALLFLTTALYEK